MRAIVVLGAAMSAAAIQALAQELAASSRVVRIEQAERAERLATLDELWDRLDYLRGPVDVQAVCEPPSARHSEAGMLRREHRWREKQGRAMINARVKAQRRGGYA